MFSVVLIGLFLTIHVNSTTKALAGLLQSRLYAMGRGVPHNHQRNFYAPKPLVSPLLYAPFITMSSFAGFQCRKAIGILRWFKSHCNNCANQILLEAAPYI